MACAASPRSTTGSLNRHGAHRTVTSEPTSLSRKSSSSDGIKGAASGNVFSKYARTSSRVAKSEKEFSPVNGQKQVHVYEPSTFGSPVIMKPPRGQIWSD